MLASPHWILRGYGPDDRIVCGTGGVVATPGIPDRAALLLARNDIALVGESLSRCTALQVRGDDTG